MDASEKPKRLHAEDRIPLVVLVANALLFLAFLFAVPPYDFSIREKTVTPLRWILLAIGLALLIITIARFFQRYRANPSEIRRIVLLSLVFFAAAITMFTLTSILRPDDRILKDYVQSYNTFFLLAAVYYLVHFGMKVLLQQTGETRARKALRVLLDVMVLVVLGLFVASMLERITLHVKDDTILKGVWEIFLYVLVVYVTAFLVVMAIKSLKISRKTTEARYKQGMIYLGISFLLISSVIVFLALLEAVGIDNDLILAVVQVAVVILAIVTFYCIYLGFVKPAAAG